MGTCCMCGVSVDTLRNTIRACGYGGRVEFSCFPAGFLGNADGICPKCESVIKDRLDGVLGVATMHFRKQQTTDTNQPLRDAASFAVNADVTRRMDDMTRMMDVSAEQHYAYVNRVRERVEALECKVESICRLLHRSKPHASKRKARKAK